jgi:hypothetical protein
VRGSTCSETLSTRIGIRDPSVGVRTLYEAPAGDVRPYSVQPGDRATIVGESAQSRPRTAWRRLCGGGIRSSPSVARAELSVRGDVPGPVPVRRVEGSDRTPSGKTFYYSSLKAHQCHSPERRSRYYYSCSLFSRER